MNHIIGLSDHQTFSHEFGHHISHMITSSWDSIEIKSDTKHKIAKTLRNQIIDCIIENSKMIKEKLEQNPREKKFITNREEVFARAFATYICYKGGNPKIYEDNNRIWLITLNINNKQVTRRIYPEYYLEDIQLVDKYFQDLIKCLI